MQAIKESNLTDLLENLKMYYSKISRYDDIKIYEMCLISYYN